MGSRNSPAKRTYLISRSLRSSERRAGSSIGQQLYLVTWGYRDRDNCIEIRGKRHHFCIRNYVTHAPGEDIGSGHMSLIPARNNTCSVPIQANREKQWTGRRDSLLDISGRTLTLSLHGEPRGTLFSINPGLSQKSVTAGDDQPRKNIRVYSYYYGWESQCLASTSCRRKRYV